MFYQIDFFLMNCREVFLRNTSISGHRLIRYVYCISKEMFAASTSASTASLWATLNQFFQSPASPAIT